MSTVPGDVRLKSQRFRQERESDWKRLEKLMDRAEKGSARKLSDDDILAIPVLYRSTLSALSVARETSLDRALIGYLETLCARAYFFVYGSRSTLSGRLKSFFQKDWPAAVQATWKETCVSGLLMLGGAVAAAVLVGQEPDWFYAFVPGELAGGRDPAASTETLRATLAGEDDSGGLSAFATFLFTHNAQVALLAFALGFALCIRRNTFVANGANMTSYNDVPGKPGRDRKRKRMALNKKFRGRDKRRDKRPADEIEAPQGMELRDIVAHDMAQHFKQKEYR